MALSHYHVYCRLDRHTGDSREGTCLAALVDALGKLGRRLLYLL